ncbi:MAG: hypothetical protein IJ399_01425 [Bacilli bacterium]|nr:hypothetical protein [Bacilli bacterium]MBQ8659830.1 hypothetical protein [Bacilli bacterium]
MVTNVLDSGELIIGFKTLSLPSLLSVLSFSKPIPDLSSGLNTTNTTE